MPYKDEEKNRECRRNWNLKNKEKMKKWSLEYYYRNRDKRLKQMNERYYRVKDTPEEIEKRKIWWKEFWAKNKDRLMKEKITNPKRKEMEAIRRFAYIHFRDNIIQERKCCEICGSIENLEIHHKNYTRDIRDIQLLCRKCHGKMKRKERWNNK